jgi:adenylate cyclase
MFEQALEMLDEALSLRDGRDERWWEPELHRLRGEFLMRASECSDPQVARIYPAREASEGACTRALELARNMGAKSLELRAATTLSRLWDEQGKSAAARQLLRTVYDSFTEGHDTRDLREAREQLERLTTKSDVSWVVADVS